MSKHLKVIGAKSHNLKNISVNIPKNKLTVITGISGSGKSSLAFNTIYNEGQKRYLESLSTYARMFIGNKQEEAEVSEIEGLSPTISIDQKTVSHNPRSTVGTITEIYDYYKLLFLHIADRTCIKCGSKVKKDSIKKIIEKIEKEKIGTKFIIKSPIIKNKDNLDYIEIKKQILDLGFIRFSIGDTIYTINDNVILKKNKKYSIDIIIDRLIIDDYSNDENSNTKRLKDSLELAFKVGNGLLKISLLSPDSKESGLNKVLDFSNKFVCKKCEHIPEDLNISSMSFNSHYGACPKCHGLGELKVFLEENVVCPNLSIKEGAIGLPGFGNYFFTLLEKVSNNFNFDLNTAYVDYSKEAKDIIMHGTGKKMYEITFVDHKGIKKKYSSKYEGVLNILSRRYFEGNDIKKLEEYTTSIECPDCQGHRLKQESLSLILKGINIGQLSDLCITDSINFFKKLDLNTQENKIATKVLKNINERLHFLSGVGLPYMKIARKSNTLSGGESQRIRLASQLGTKLEGIIYVLDEPSIGLHPRDNSMLIENLKNLREIGNTLIVVEHDEEIMKKADHIIDIGPGAGNHGGEVIFNGTPDEILKDKTSNTGLFLNGKKKIERKINNKSKGYIEIIGAKENNLKNISVKIPLGQLVLVTGVSGSGKSSLVNNILANYLQKNLNKAYTKEVGDVKEILGIEQLDKAIVINQSPIGKTPKSNPATYTGVFTYIREVFADVEEAKIRGYDIGRFSFNKKGGRCEECEGNGTIKVEMHFMPPIYVECEDCNGKRFNKETLQVKYKTKSISDVLNMTVEEALDFFGKHPKIKKKLSVLNEVGLGYIKLGQASTTLSGGEAQRIKLATELSKVSTKNTFYILDEPTTGLHFQDIQKLLNILSTLVEKGNSVLVIEHNTDIIKNADHIIDIGPEGGDTGGKVIYTGDVEGIKKCKESYTGKFIF